MKAKAKNKFCYGAQMVEKDEVFECTSTDFFRLVKYDLVKEYKQKRKTKELKTEINTKDESPS